jgi:hypothetical protein
MEQNSCSNSSQTTLDQKALLAQEQVIFLQDVYKIPVAFSNKYTR